MSQTNIASILQEHKTSKTGLTNTEALKRLKKYGPNILKVKKATPLWKHFIEEFTDLMVIILIFAAVVSLLAGESKDSIVIFIIVLINAIIGFIQKYRAEKAIEALKKLIAPTSNVIRNGEEITIEAKALIPGDILILREGDQITADATLIEANELRTQEATLTGESTPIAKTSEFPSKKSKHIAERHNQIFMGTLVAHGSGQAVVTGTGMNTEFGKIAKLTTETEKSKSPLQKELFRIGVFVGKVTFAISAILFAISVAFQGEPIVKAFLFATAVAVAAVPEGLPATITIALAMGVQRLAKKNAIVKQLSSVETLGSTTVICSDKTGTLTKNEMTVKEIIMSDYSASISGVGYKPDGVIKMNDGPMELIISSQKKTDKKNKDYKTIAELEINHPHIFERLRHIHTVSILCNNATLKNNNNNWEIIGDPTEGALLTLATKTGFNPNHTKQENKRIYEIPFDSKRKSMTVIAQNSKSKKITAYTKGAPDNILENCSHIYHNGELIKLTEKLKKEILKKNEKMAKKALRTIGMAIKEIKGKKRNSYTAEETETNLTFVGIVGMIDPPREDVHEAVRLAQKAGIRTYIITGDHGLTAEAIAIQIGMVGKREHKIITGAELNNLSDSELKQSLQENIDIIFARVDPEHKLRIVTALKDLNQVIAVTGDGVNDAPALKKADIGIAMGITGTDVSKEASNMILADDSYSTIVKAIEEGRTIYENLKKFVFYIFSCNIGELTTIFAAILLSIPAPLTAVLILAVDIGTDILPALALGVDPTEKGIMNLPPRNPKKRIMDFQFNIRFTYLGLAIGAVVVSTYVYALHAYGWQWGQTLDNESFIHIKGSSMAFAVLVLIQMANAFNSRSEQQSAFTVGLFSNRYLLGAIIISIITVIGFIEIPFFQNWLHTTGLTAIEWIIVAGGSISIFVIEEIRKLFRNKTTQH